MSSELRLKKLRGSGGYVMASVTDQQQAKGNLGGPDLFLAPIGRIDPGKISRYRCNTCEKEFEGSPKIDFESPNEEVAENLVLVERGQYVCGACSSVIAEYREFKKSVEGQEVGMAKPMQDAGAEPPAQVQQAPEQEPEPQAPAKAQQPASAEPKSPAVSSIEGMTVFDENACKLGVAKQVGVDHAQQMVLIIAKDDGAEVSVPWNMVRTVGEVILLGGTDAPQQAADEPGRCAACGLVNKADAKCCEECGSRLA